MKERAIRFVTFVAVPFILMALLGWWLSLQWDECRSMGFSVLYCIQHIA